MPNPQQPELARSRKSGATSDDALPTKAARSRSKKGATAPGPVPEDNLPGHVPDVVPDKPLLPPGPYRLHSDDDADTVATGGGSGGGADLGTAGPTSVRFAFLFDRLLTPAALAFGVTSRTASVTVDDDELVIRFGPWSLRTSRDNIAGAEVTGPYRVHKIAGPPHLSLKDRGVTFATSRRAGACIRFHEPVTGLLPFGLIRHPAATVTVTNPGDLVRRLTESG